MRTEYLAEAAFYQAMGGEFEETYDPNDPETMTLEEWEEGAKWEEHIPGALVQYIKAIDWVINIERRTGA